MNTRTVLASLLATAAVLGGCGLDEAPLMVGTLERDRVELKVESNEPIVGIDIADGSRVTAGDVVLRQDPARLAARLRQARAQRDQAAARLAELQRGPRQESIREAQARLEAGAAITRNTQAAFERAREVFARGLSDQATLDDARAAWEAARAREQADREALSALLTGTTVEELQQARAQLDATQAQVAQAQLDLERLTLHAPLSGIIDKVLYQQGERPAIGATVAVLLDGSRSYARIYVPEQLRASIVPGVRLVVSVDGVAETLPATVRWVSADASFTPYFALTEHDRSRLSYLAEADLDGAGELPVGVPLEARLPAPE